MSVIKLERKRSCSVMSDSLQPHGLKPTRLLHPWDFPGKNTGVGCHFLLQEIFPNQGLNPGLPHCRQTLYHLSHQGRVIIKLDQQHISAGLELGFQCIWEKQIASIYLLAHFLSSHPRASIMSIMP